MRIGARFRLCIPATFHQKLELKRTTELEKAKFLGDADKTAKAQALINAKADLDTQKASGKASVALAKTIADEKINSQKSTFDTIATLSNSSNSTLAAIGKAAGITQIAIQTPVAVSKALAAFPPPFNFVAAGLVGTAMAAQAAKIAGVSGFANGGVVGGFQGATAGADNQLATVRSGEMFLNAPQQKQLFDVANGASSGGNSDAVMAALSQPIIIQVDNREIARANRTAVQEGFSAA